MLSAVRVAGAAELKFRVQEISNRLSIGYAMRLVDMNDDGKTDIVVVDTERVMWFENPTWQMHTLIEGQTKADNVSIAPYDIDGDGKVDFALGADWRPADTRDQRHDSMAFARTHRHPTSGPCIRSAPSRRCIAFASPISTATAARN